MELTPLATIHAQTRKNNTGNTKGTKSRKSNGKTDFETGVSVKAGNKEIKSYAKYIDIKVIMSRDANCAHSGWKKPWRRS